MLHMRITDDKGIGFQVVIPETYAASLMRNLHEEADKPGFDMADFIVASENAVLIFTGQFVMGEIGVLPIVEEE